MIWAGINRQQIFDDPIQTPKKKPPIIRRHFCKIELNIYQCNQLGPQTYWVNQTTVLIAD